jgi:hypothetical protein
MFFTKIGVGNMLHFTQLAQFSSKQLMIKEA